MTEFKTIKWAGIVKYIAVTGMILGIVLTIVFAVLANINNDFYGWEITMTEIFGIVFVASGLLYLTISFLFMNGNRKIVKK